MVYHAYKISHWKKLDETWYVDGVTIIGVPFCGLKGIWKKTTDMTQNPTRCQNYAIKFVDKNPPS